MDAESRLPNQLAYFIEPIFSGIRSFSGYSGPIAQIGNSKKERTKESQILGVEGAVDKNV
jgi:hypothetical protein